MPLKNDFGDGWSAQKALQKEGQNLNQRRDKLIKLIKDFPQLECTCNNRSPIYDKKV